MDKNKNKILLLIPNLNLQMVFYFLAPLRKPDKLSNLPMSISNKTRYKFVSYGKPSTRVFSGKLLLSKAKLANSTLLLKAKSSF